FLFIIAQAERENTFPPGLNRFGFGFGGLSGIGTIKSSGFVCLTH
ncbi:hypothetical protein Q604_UNBC02606G0002, partial [human gut metagenome]